MKNTYEVEIIRTFVVRVTVDKTVVNDDETPEDAAYDIACSHIDTGRFGERASIIMEDQEFEIVEVEQ